MENYAFIRPQNTPLIHKRSRRTKYKELQSDNTTTFGYTCFQCNSPMDINGHNDDEIECKQCSSRIIRKNKTKKSHVVQAV